MLDTEANKFYDRNHQLYDAALLTRCYTQHALRPFIDSETNHKRHFIKIPFINKRIVFIDLPSIFKDRSLLRRYLLISKIIPDCKDTKFIYPAAGHIITGNLKIISDSRIRYIVSKGPKYRFPSGIDFKKCREEIASALNDFENRWCKF